MLIPNGVAHATLFPPLLDRWRRALPEVHREVANWLRHQAVLWWITTDRFMEMCSLRIQQFPLMPYDSYTTYVGGVS